MEWAASPEIMKTSAMVGQPPARHSLFRDRELNARAPWLERIEPALEHSFARPRVPAWPQVEDALECELKSAVQRVRERLKSTTIAWEDIDYVAEARDTLAKAKVNIAFLMETFGYYLQGEYAGTPIKGSPVDSWECQG